MFVKHAPCLGRLQIRRRPLDQLQRKACFESRDMLAHRRRRHVQIFGRGGEAPPLDYPSEDRNIRETFHSNDESEGWSSPGSPLRRSGSARRNPKSQAITVTMGRHCMSLRRWPAGRCRDAVKFCYMPPPRTIYGKAAPRCIAKTVTLRFHFGNASFPNPIFCCGSALI